MKARIGSIDIVTTTAAFSFEGGQLTTIEEAELFASAITTWVKEQRKHEESSLARACVEELGSMFRESMDDAPAGFDNDREDGDAKGG